jgi:hypothetical protein
MSWSRYHCLSWTFQRFRQRFHLRFRGKRGFTRP